MRTCIKRCVCVPIHCAIVLAPRCILSVQFDASEDALLAPNTTNKLDNTYHAAGDIDCVADIYVFSVCAHPV
jgi:hypothetical protein